MLVVARDGKGKRTFNALMFSHGVSEVERLTNILDSGDICAMGETVARHGVEAQ